MKVVRKKPRDPMISGMGGYIVSDAVFSVASDTYMGSYSIAIKGDADFKDITEEEYYTIMRLFDIEERVQ